VSKVIDESGLFVLNPQLEWTGGGIASTPLDLARWGKLLYEGKAFDPKHLSAVLDGNPANTGRGDEYGLETQIWSTPQGRVHGHTGFFPGYQSAMAYYPEAKFVLATQFNTDQREHLRRPARSYLNEFAGMIIE
jgi:D-alanyl-D-alanine carboxypeptidase